jgi:hypothetical protein
MQRKIEIAELDTYVEGFGVVNERCSAEEWGAALVRMMGLAETFHGEDLVSQAHMLWGLGYVERVKRDGFSEALFAASSLEDLRKGGE